MATNCQHVDGLALACHSTCAAEGLLSLKTLKVTSWDPGFELPIAQSADLKRHLASKRASRRDLARSTLRAKEKMVEASSGEVKTSSRIWATYVTLHGDTYVSALSNNHGDDLIFDPGTISTEDVVYIRRGPLGVKKIVVACSTETLEMEHHPLDWWQVLPLAKDSVLHFEFDVSRRRRLLCLSAAIVLIHADQLRDSNCAMFRKPSEGIHGRHYGQHHSIGEISSISL